MATDYDSWRPHSESVTAAEVFKTLKGNADRARHVLATILDDLHNVISSEKEREKLLGEIGTMEYAIMGGWQQLKGKLTGEDEKKLAYVLPEYFA